MPRIFFVVFLSLALSIVAGNRSSAEELAVAGPVVVELFTSQGCSSCPPADKLLAEIDAISKKGQLPVYCLSYHVDYWNSLGWKDPYSSKLFTKRQRSYAATFNSRRVYTPQMIVNGSTEFVGSRGGDAKAAIESALATTPATKVSLEAKQAENKNSISIEYAVTGHSSGAVLNLALVQTKASNEVPRGENAGRELIHVQVVRALESLPLLKPKGKRTLNLPQGLDAEDLAVIAFVQQPDNMAISGAAMITPEL